MHVESWGSKRCLNFFCARMLDRSMTMSMQYKLGIYYEGDVK